MGIFVNPGNASFTEALNSKKDFYAKKWQQNNYYPIDKFVYHLESDTYEQLIQKKQI